LYQISIKIQLDESEVSFTTHTCHSYRKTTSQPGLL